ncbi:MAG: histidine kinase [Bacteroidetes bacterium]|nr:histidine kinase [Bacteroidota bacterium]
MSKKKSDEASLAKELALQNEEKEKREAELAVANKELALQTREKEKRSEEREKRAEELIIANKELAFQNDEKEKRAAELIIANKELAFQNNEKEKRAAELIIANEELAFQNHEKEKRAAELIIANKELAFQNDEKEKRAAELIIANKELTFQNEEKEKRAAELIIANKELNFQNKEKEKRAVEKEKRAEELIIANKELAFQNEEKEKRAAELIIANEELAFQNNEKEKRAAELIIANKELAFQNEEKEKRAAEKEKRAEELIIANKELAFQNEEKEKRAAELIIANKELAFQNEEKEKRAAEKEKRAEELIIANKELAFQNEEKEKREAELLIANEELAFQNNEKEKRAAELIIANKELAFQNVEKEKRAAELSIANTLAGKQVVELAQQAEELQMQQEELKQMNEELEEQAQNLKQQQEELQLSNEELGGQTRSLEEKNKEVEAARYDIEQKTKQLEVSSKYKSEFLANMSHELRTPLNSLLILSKDLSENRKNHMDEEEVESAEIIYKSGHDLLILINEVLDLSKIEAGKMQINIEKVSLKNFIDYLIRDFKHQSEQKGLKLTYSLDKELPESIRTDSQRLNQILKNLISNAIKFTEKGNVNITAKRHTEKAIIISISDTGIGIQEDKQMSIFEAFQQADGGTSRKFGGTGLGLSISRELAKLLGSEIRLTSKLNEGSTFSVIIPFEIHGENEPVKTTEVNTSALSKPQTDSYSKYLNHPTIKDDRDIITQDDRVVLIIEDDLNFAAILLKQANHKGFKCLSAATGEDGLLLTAKYKPQAIILDMQLPGIDGHKVLLDLKADPSVRHIPVHIISASERSLESIKEGAVECLMKPIDKSDLDKAFNRIENFINRKIKNLLIIEDNDNARKAMRVLIGNGDVKCLEAGTGKDALAIYQQNQIDCIILDIGLPDMTGFELIHKLEDLNDQSLPPIVVYTGKELTKEENDELLKYSESIIIKGIKSEERLLDETALFLHRTITNLPKSKQLMINSLHDSESFFHVKNILLVDDDTRNVFALSKILKARGMSVITAENGKNALDMLEIHPEIDLVLMDIMMPEMDGYEAMRRIRTQKKFKNLPVIALTAKAMKEDKQKCIEAGASDYITKPIDMDRLLSLMRVWLSK